MKKNYFLLLCSLLLGVTIQAQSGTGHDPDLVLSYTPSGYTAAPTMRQDNGVTDSSKNTINNNGGGTDLFFNFTFDTSGKNMFVAYTVDGTDPNTSSTAVSGAFSNYSEPNRTWIVTIPAQSSGVTVKYIFYASDSDIASSWGRISATGYTTNLGDAYTPFSYKVYESNVAAGGNWATGATWNSGSSPNSSTMPVEIIGTNSVILDQNANVENLNVTATASLSINSGNSLIVNGTSNGNVIYNTTLGTENWYLMSSPVSGVTFNDTFVTANSIASGTISSSNRGIGTYNTSSDDWTYLQSGGTISSTTGIGYSVKQSTAGNVAFTGTINTNNSGVDVTLSNTGNRFNLLGNPYTANIASATFLNNESAISETQNIWVWNQSLGTSGEYEVKDASDAFIIAPTQGFFVRANSAGGTFNFSEANQSLTGGTFQKQSPLTSIKLWINNESTKNYMRLRYMDNASNGFDIGKDGEVFGGLSSTFSVYTELISNNEGKKYQLQSLPNQDFESMVIPVGVIAASGKEITFTAEALNLPSGIKVYLEDREANNVTRLDEANSNYKVTLNTALNGTGRFFLHTRSSALSTEEVALTGVGMYTINKNTLRVNGINSDKASIKIYNILGKKVLESSFTSKGVSDVSLPNLNTGVYIVQLVTEKGKISKKIILE